MKFYIFTALILALLSVDLYLRDESQESEPIRSIHIEKGAINSIVVKDTVVEYKPTIHIDPLTGREIRFK